MNTSSSSVAIPRHLLHTKDYLTEFDTEAYLSGYTFYEMIPSFDLLLQEMVRIFIKNSSQFTMQHALEFGGGPTLVSSFLLAQYVDSIHFTDYTPSNLSAVEGWIERDDNAHEWSDLFHTIFQEHKKQFGRKTGNLSDWEERLRNALKRGGLSRCADVNDSYCPILDGKDNMNHYDVILSSFCLEDACLTLEAYRVTIKRLSALLKPGGSILLIHGRNQTFYSVLGKHFFTLPLDESTVRQSLHQAGFIDIQITSIAKCRTPIADADGFLIAYAVKPKLLTDSI